MVSIIIVTYNARDFIRFCLDSLERQSFRDFHVLVVDNGSGDDTKKILAEYPTVSTIVNKNNLGFCRANNQGITLALENNSASKPSYILLLNQDVILEQNALEELVRAADQNRAAVQFGPKILRFRIEREQDEERVPVLTKTIDTTGIFPLKSYQVVSRGEGREDSDEFPDGEVWGCSGTCMLITARACEILKVKTREYLDEDLYMYKDDVDLAFRVRRLGLKAWYVPSSVVYHYRTERGAIGDLTGWNFGNNLRVARRKKNWFTTFYGYRNQLLVLYKNLTPQQWLRGLPFILWFEFRKIVFFFFTQPGMLFRAWKEFLQLRKKMKFKREIMNEVSSTV